jgi:hypothetical protein
MVEQEGGYTVQQMFSIYSNILIHNKTHLLDIVFCYTMWIPCWEEYVERLLQIGLRVFRELFEHLSACKHLNDLDLCTSFGV